MRFGQNKTGIYINSLFGRIASLLCARNPHVPLSTFRLLRASRLALHPEKRIYMDAQKKYSRKTLDKAAPTRSTAPVMHKYDNVVTRERPPRPIACICGVSY
jgi:hypothetical protein